MVTPPRRHLLLCLLANPLAAAAHGLKAGDLVIDHPYALPSAPGSSSSSVHFRALRNAGSHADTLLSASTEAAGSVLIQRRGETLQTLPLPPGSSLNARHDGDIALRLQGLKAPLQDGDRVTVQLRFERAGVREIVAWVQTPARR